MNVKVFQIRLGNEHTENDQEIVNEFLESVTVKKTAAQHVNGKFNCWSLLVFFENKKTEAGSTTRSEKISFPSDAPLNAEEEHKFKILKQWRFDKASKQDIPAYMVCSNAELVSLVKAPVTTLADIAKIKGFGEQKITKYGQEIIEAINKV
ncbi:MAG: HRDC domain-containing protein [Bacteroidia bacterium]|nr:HRDC domain-containing protein [Bacteroidia bacterium]